MLRHIDGGAHNADLDTELEIDGIRDIDAFPVAEYEPLNLRMAQNLIISVPYFAEQNWEKKADEEEDDGGRWKLKMHSWFVLF